MKTKNKILNTLVVLILLTIASCTKDFETINKNPNSPTDVPTENILTFGIINTVIDMNDSWINMSYWGCWVQHLAKIQYIDEDKYAFRTSTINTYWRLYFAQELQDFNTIIKKSKADSKPNMEAIGRVMKAYVFQMVTDSWGDIPYFEALKGDSGITTPKYDSQRAIYLDMINELTTANNLFNTSADAIGAGDLIYGGNITLWKKFCNSLKLRMLIRISKVEPALAQAGIEEILGSPATFPVFSANTDDAQLVFVGTQPYRNPYYENKYGDGRDDHAVSKTLVDMLISYSDPRLPVYALPAESDSVYRGQVNGAASQPNLADISRIGRRFRDDPKAACYLMTYSEVLFIIAEAAQNGWNTGGIAAASAYDNAITANMSKWGITSTAITTYLAGSSVDFSLAANKYEAIAIQKWLSLFTQEAEAFAEYRRSGFPVLQPAVASIYPGHNVPPFRFPYPTDEESLNAANLAPAKAGIVDFLWGKQVWWDRRTGLN